MLFKGPPPGGPFLRLSKIDLGQLPSHLPTFVLSYHQPSSPFLFLSSGGFMLVDIMIELVKKSMLAGLGLAVVTKDKVLESLHELVEKGNLSKEEAAAMSEKIVAAGEAETEKAKVEASQLFNQLLQRANVVTKDQYDALAARVTELEGRLHKEFPNAD